MIFTKRKRCEVNIYDIYGGVRGLERESPSLQQLVQLMILHHSSNVFSLLL